MPDDHSIRVKCAEDFKEIRGMLGRIANDKEHDRAAFHKLTDVVERSITENRSWHDESVRQLAAYNTQVIALNGQVVERMATVEAKATSAHHRLDSFAKDTDKRISDLAVTTGKKLEDIAGIFRAVAITVIGALVIAAVIGIFKYAAYEQDRNSPSASSSSSTTTGG